MNFNFARVLRYMAWLVTLAVSALTALPVLADKASAQALREQLPALEQAAAAGDYQAAQKLAHAFSYGITYQTETIQSRLTSQVIPDILKGGRANLFSPEFRAHAVLDPQPVKLKRVLEMLAASGDAWAQFKLAELRDRPMANRLDNPYRTGPPITREFESVFAADPALSLSLYAQAASSATRIIEGQPMAVYTGNTAVHAPEQKTFLQMQHRVVVLALQRLAELRASTPGTQDWLSASDDYQRLADLIAAPAFLTTEHHLQRFLLSDRETALLKIADMRIMGGHGLAADCPAALGKLRRHAETFPDAATRPLGDLDRVRAYGELQSRIGLIYYRGCTGQAVNRTEAFAWFRRVNAGTIKRTSIDSKASFSAANDLDLSPLAIVALAELLDNGAPGMAARPKEAFDAYWVARPDGAVLLRVAQMIETGLPYTSLEPERATLFYCRAASEFFNPYAQKWLQAHPAVRCKP